MHYSVIPEKGGWLLRITQDPKILTFYTFLAVNLFQDSEAPILII